MGDGSFLEYIATLFNDEVTGGAMAAGLIVLLSIPAALLGQLFKAAPDWLLPPERIPKLLGLLGAIGGAALGYFTPLPTPLMVASGIAAGLGSRSVHDEHNKIKKHPNGGGDA